MARLLWFSDGGCNSGFGNVTHNIGERLVRDYGHEIHVLAVNHTGDDYPSILDPAKQSPLRLYMPRSLSGNDLYGFSRVIEMLGLLGESPKGLDGVVMLNDPQVILQFLYENPYDQKQILATYRPIIAYLPCDGTNLPPVWTQLIPRVTDLITMSKWGQSLYQPSDMVYHGVDTTTFHPVREEPIKLPDGSVLRTKKDCKRRFGFNPDSFVIGRIDRNSGRKDFGATLAAVLPLMSEHKDIELYLHSAANDRASGVNIPMMVTRWPDVDASRIHLPAAYNPNRGLAPAEMAGLYNAFDLFVSTSRGEGFGLTLAESAACGVPIVAQNVSAIPEVVGPGGVLLEPQRLLTVPSGEDVWLCDVNAFSREIRHLYEARGVLRKLGEAGREHVRSSFSWDAAAAKFHDHITGLSSRKGASPEEV